MATWRDGPEYAPLGRPAAFITPEAPPLQEAEAAEQPEPIRIPQRPLFTPPQDGAPDLAELVPASGPARDPETAFQTYTSPLTSVAAPTSERNPEQPFDTVAPMTGYLPTQTVVQPTAQVNPAPFPAPGTTEWFGPPQGDPVPARNTSVGFGQIWSATTTWVLLPLFLGILLQPLSALLLASSFVASSQIAYRRRAVRTSYAVAGTVIAVMVMFSYLSGAGDDVWDSLSSAAQFSCLVLPWVIGGIVWSALRAGESPDQDR